MPPRALPDLLRLNLRFGIARRGSVALVRIVDGSGGGRGAQRQIIGVEVDWSAAKFDPQIAVFARNGEQAPQDQASTGQRIDVGYDIDRPRRALWGTIAEIIST